MKTPHDEMTDLELDKLLSLASKPPRHSAAAEALVAKIATSAPTSPGSNVVNFPPRQKPQGIIPWLAALPLAASLAAGIWLGAAGQGTGYLFNTSEDLTTVSDNFDASTGIDDAEILTEEDLS